jgi:hypothetical protein
METGLSPITGSPFLPNTSRQHNEVPQDTETPTSETSDTDAPNETQPPTTPNEVSEPQKTTATPPASEVAKATPPETQSAVLAQLADTATPDETLTDATLELRENLARASAEKAIEESRQMLLIDQLKSPPLGSAQILGTNPDTTPKDTSNPYSVTAPSEAST